MLYHQTTINQTKINELKTVPCSISFGIKNVLQITVMIQE